MNERIRELAEQRGLTGPNYLISSHELEKCAELIIRDCLDVLKRRFMGDLNREDMEVKRCIEDVKKHFGVE